MESPAMRLSVNVAVACVVPSYVLFCPVAVTTSVRCVMSAAVTAVEFAM